jgi:hypothetical protein
MIGNDNKKKVVARIDTGAAQSSIDTALAKELNLGPIISTKLVKSAHGSTLRAVVKAEFILAKKRIKAKFNVADRRHMRYKVLLGRNALKNRGFLINPDKE